MKLFLLISLTFLNSIQFSTPNQIEVVKFFKNKIEFENGMVVEIPLDKLKINYPGLTSQLLRSTKNPILSKTVFSSTQKNKFLYFNNSTRNFEGVSIQSTFTNLKNLTLITTTTEILPTNKRSLNQLPLYNQFIYTIKTNENSHDLLNEQSEFSSKLRLSLIKEIARNFALNYTSLKLNWIEKLNESLTVFNTKENSEFILVSVSNVHILNLQKIYLNLFNEHNENKIDNKFRAECDNFYKDLRTKHTGSENVLNIQKVQFVKLCNLTQIRAILNETNESKQLSMAKKLINLNTEEISWASDDDLNYDYGGQNETVLLTNLKSFSNSSTFVDKIEAFGDDMRRFFWKLVPEEDFLVAVIVPCIVIISILVLSIVIACLLHMCKRHSISDTKNLISPSNTTESSYHSKTFERVNPLYKEKAYLSKGVPVILYEEMSDKPIEEFDENDAEILASGNYRLPLIMHNEKPPVPAPPEYTRPAYYAPQVKASESILNELQSMLQQSANIISLAETPKELSPSKSIKSNTSSNSPFHYDNEEHLVLINNKNNKNTCSLVKTSDKKFNNEKLSFS